MPVVIRKGSWEEHVTHASGLQYSYDDLDLVCCHGVGSGTSWMGSGASKQGQRIRCASMPEGYQQLPTAELAETREVTTSVMKDDIESKEFKIMKSNVKVPLDLQEDSFTGQCCSLTAEKLDTGFSEGNHTQANIARCVDQYLETTASVSQPRESRHESSVPRDLPCCEDQTVAQQLENSSSKLDTIPEVSHVEQDDTLVLDPQKNSNFTQNPDVQQSHVDDSCVTTEHDTENLPPCSAEVCVEHSPGGLHSNQEAFGCCFSESPGSEAADGQWEHHRPAATVSRMEDEAAHTRENTRLDSMVLLLMKLDQLDQEIESALSATSSMDSTPTLHRRQLLEGDTLQVRRASSNPLLAHLMTLSAFLSYCLENKVRVNKASYQ
uniref:Uncharacterized protein n=1 Tax=Mola mola TaxID=94237 RepID=A0A3Q3W065_MOLML